MTSYVEGSVEGYDEGYAEGSAEGYDEGYAEGYADGYAEGYAKNKKELDDLKEGLRELQALLHGLIPVSENNEEECFTDNYINEELRSIDITSHNILDQYNDKKVQLWQFPVTTKSRDNYEYEINQHMKGEGMQWSKPVSFDKYDDFVNICLITDTDKETVDICEISQSDDGPREHWSEKFRRTGSIQVKLIGRHSIKSKVVAGFCEYKAWSIGGKFQPVKNVTFKEFANNLDAHLKNVKKMQKNAKKM